LGRMGTGAVNMRIMAAQAAPPLARIGPDLRLSIVAERSGAVEIGADWRMQSRSRALGCAGPAGATVGPPRSPGSQARDSGGGSARPSFRCCRSSLRSRRGLAPLRRRRRLEFPPSEPAAPRAALLSCTLLPWTTSHEEHHTQR
jgi:hypothetical protein